jgi:Uma2 family endonuclease
MISLPVTQDWTYERMRRELPEGSRYELHRFQLIDMSPAPKLEYQKIVKRLFRLFDQFVENNQLGEAYFAPLDVVFSDGEVCQPDILVLANDQLYQIKDDAIHGTPGLIVEVVSKGSVARDYVEKKEEYERSGVQEYWIVDPWNESIVVYGTMDGKFQMIAALESKGELSSTFLPGLTIDVAKIFA